MPRSSLAWALTADGFSAEATTLRVSVRPRKEARNAGAHDLLLAEAFASLAAACSGLEDAECEWASRDEAKVAHLKADALVALTWQDLTLMLYLEADTRSGPLPQIADRLSRYADVLRGLRGVMFVCDLPVRWSNIASLLIVTFPDRLLQGTHFLPGVVTSASEMGPLAVELLSCMRRRVCSPGAATRTASTRKA